MMQDARCKMKCSLFRSPLDVLRPGRLPRVIRLQELEKRARMKAQVLLRLFKVVFGSVTLFPKNERMLRPHLQTIVLSCLRYTTRVKDPTNYYFLLRALFRSISGGKFESSYKVGALFLPVLAFQTAGGAGREIELLARHGVLRDNISSGQEFSR